MQLAGMHLLCSKSELYTTFSVSSSGQLLRKCLRNKHFLDLFFDFWVVAINKNCYFYCCLTHDLYVFFIGLNTCNSFTVYVL